MCGIVGYVGSREATPVLISGLEKLEYRGYDSAGTAVIEDGQFLVHRSVGKLRNLKTLLGEKLEEKKSSSGLLKIGIGHTRWATHGRPSETNAHPHIAGDICVVHNGIIENYALLRKKLEEEHACTFESETDTEIAAHLIQVYSRKSKNLREAVRKAVSELEGSYALVVLSLCEPDRIVVARNATPIVLGLSENEKFIASDIPAVLEYTREVVILEDGDIAEISPSAFVIEREGKPIERESIHVTWDPITAEKGGYRHFMLKEICEQAQAITDTFRGRIDRENVQVFLDEISLSPKEIQNIDRVCLVACGTAWHAALITKFFIEKLARIHVEVDYASEYRYRNPLIDGRTLFVAISQSGETADTLGALQLAAERGARTLAICNVVGSTVSRRAESVLYTHAGPEISVASTKAFVTQLVAGYLLALHLGNVRGVLGTEEARACMDDLVHLPTQISAVTQLSSQMEEIAKKFGRSSNFLYLARGLLYPIALEGALKLKEISYLHAEGYPAGEMKHGPIALIDEETPVVVVLGKDGVNREKTVSNLIEVQARGGRVICITDKTQEDIQGVAEEIIEVGDVSPLMLPIVTVVPLQLLAYHIAVYRGTDVDQPRNLAKSVTVE